MYLVVSRFFYPLFDLGSHHFTYAFRSKQVCPYETTMGVEDYSCFFFFFFLYVALKSV